ncbi:hypothetical protein L2E82_51870 [Cichorium intybus]|nr:hypothetical protein L2E82_51870 [Cichorium intybus]
MHINSLQNANVKTLWEDDVHEHYVMRRYAEFTASLIHLNVDYGDGQEAGPEGGKIQLRFEEQYSYLCDSSTQTNNKNESPSDIWTGKVQCVYGPFDVEVPMFTSSGLRVRLLKVWEKSG